MVHCLINGGLSPLPINPSPLRKDWISSRSPTHDPCSSATCWRYNSGLHYEQLNNHVIRYNLPDTVVFIKEAHGNKDREKLSCIGKKSMPISGLRLVYFPRQVTTSSPEDIWEPIWNRVPVLVCVCCVSQASSTQGQAVQQGSTSPHHLGNQRIPGNAWCEEYSHWGSSTHTDSWH